MTNANPISIISCYEPDGVSNLYRITCGADFQFCYGWYEPELLGDTLIVSGYALNGYWLKGDTYWGIRLLNPYQGITPQLVTIKVESIDWHSYEVTKETKYFDLTILPDNFKLGAENYINTGVVGEKVYAEIFIEPGSNTNALTIPPNTIKLNLEIIKGAYLGNIEISEKNLIGKVINNVDHEEGKLKFSFVANGNLALEEDTVIVRVSSSDPNVDDPKMKDLVFVIMKYEPLEVTIIPATPTLGEPANIIVKKRNSDGTLTDFCADQWFDIEITDGADYATFFIPDWNDTTDHTQFVNQGFQLLITKPIPNGAPQPTILVKTSGQMASSIIPTDTGQNEKYNNQKKSLVLQKNFQKTIKTKSALSTGHLIQKNNLAINKPKTINNNGDCILWDSVILWGTAATQAEPLDTLYIKADFEKATLSAGDTVIIRVTKVDKNGNESSFPAGTLFEAKVLEGCLGGELLSSDNRTGKYLANLTQPFYFIVDKNIDSTITNIEIKVGAPVSGYLSYDDSFNNVNGKIINASMNRVKQTKILKKQMDSDGCSTSPFASSSYDYARGNVGGGCDHLPCYTNNVPTAPTIDLKPFNNRDICNKKSGYAFTDYNWDGKQEFPTQPLDFVKSFNVCYNKNLNRWILTLYTDPIQTLKFQYEQDYCWNKINVNWYNKYQRYPIIIENYKSFVVPSDTNERALLKADLEAHQKYPISPDRIKKYVLKDFIIAHENGHADGLRKIINDVYTNEKYPEYFLNKFNYSCSKLSSAKMAQDTALKFLQTFEQKLIKAIAAEYQKKVLGSDIGDRERLDSIHNYSVYNSFMKRVFKKFGFTFVPVKRWWL
ncbi:MAG: hypothetical protein ACYC6D_07140 [Melioribacteraceae bacterium]